MQKHSKLRVHQLCQQMTAVQFVSPHLEISAIPVALFSHSRLLRVSPHPDKLLGMKKPDKPITPELLLSYGIPHHLVGETMQAIQQSDKRHLLALKLLQLLFTKEELSTSNCGGNFGKQQLDGIRLELMKRKCHFISSFFFRAVRCSFFFVVAEERNTFFACLLPPRKKEHLIVGYSLYYTQGESCRL